MSTVFRVSGIFGNSFGTRVPFLNDGAPQGVVQGRQQGFLPHANDAFGTMGCPHTPEEEEAAAEMGCPKCKRKRKNWTLTDPNMAGFKPPSGGFPIPWGQDYEEEERLRRKAMQGFMAPMMRQIPLKRV